MFPILIWGILCINQVFGEWDQKCIDTCRCCKNESCFETFFPNACAEGCIDGHRGGRCYELCRYSNCKSCGGITSSKECGECYDGFYLGPNKDCTSKCPPKCKECTSSTNCTKCKDGFYDKNGSTTCKYARCPANCECTESQTDCVSCKQGYYNISVGCSEPCSINCVTCESGTLCNICRSGFYNGREYDNSKSQLQKTCMYVCRESCTQCQSYNNCVTCTRGKYGSTCQNNCSVGCKDNFCSIDSGHCDCTDTFIGYKCTECVNGRYGLFCNQSCPKYCKGLVCDRSSSDCIDGCINENITGNTCNKCAEGMFGEVCNILCPKNCRKIGCARYSGLCTDGCTGNFNGALCDQCIPGKYGRNCELDCPVGCAGNVCERSTGMCFDCITHFQGTSCNSCKDGFYGPLCDDLCSEFCDNSTCDRETGKCVYGCTDDYSGDRCCVRSNHCAVCYSNIECWKCEPGFFRHLCTRKCPKNCLGSCDMSTGECDDDEETDKPVATAILGSFFAVSLVIIVVQNLFVLIKKRKTAKREASRHTPDSTYENQLKSAAPHLSENKESTIVSAGKKNVYEEINRAYDADHEYQQISSM